MSFLYFAYGSNMLTERLTARTPSAEPQGTGVLAGYRLTFEKPSVGRSGTSGKGDITETHQPADRVLGVVFKILTEHFEVFSPISPPIFRNLIKVWKNAILSDLMSYKRNLEALNCRAKIRHGFRLFVPGQTAYPSPHLELCIRYNRPASAH